MIWISVKKRLLSHTQGSMDQVSVSLVCAVFLQFYEIVDFCKSGNVFYGILVLCENKFHVPSVCREELPTSVASISFGECNA